MPDKLMLTTLKSPSVSFVYAEGCQRLDRYIKHLLPGCSYASLQKHVRRGHIRVQGNKVAAPYRLQGGETITMPQHLLEACQRPEVSKEVDPTLQHWVQEVKTWCVYQDEAWLVVNKPAGIESQPGGQQANLQDILEAWLGPQGKKPYGLHRLDRPTSGLVLVALDKVTAAWGAEQFRQRHVEKKYYACVKGHPAEPEGSMKQPLFHPQGEGIQPVRWGQGKPAVTNYRVWASHGPHSFLELQPITGRRHQLRAHCASEGWPIVGDVLYGGPPAPQLKLCAYSIAWHRADGSRREVNLAPPAWMKGVTT